MSLLKGASVYFGANILSSLIPFLLLPILTRYLSPSEYGQIAMFQTLLSALGVLVGLNVIGAASRKYYDDDINETILKQFNGSCIQILVVSNIISYILLTIFKNTISEYLGIPSDWVFSAILISASTFIVSMRLSQWQIRGNAKLFGFLQVTNTLVNSLLSLLLIIVFVQGAKGRVDAQVITSFIIGMIAFSSLYKDKLLDIKSFKIKFIKEALSFGVPLIPHHVGGLIILSASRIVINEKLSLTDVGVYMVAFQLSSTMSILFDALNKAYVPWLFERLKNNNEIEKKNIYKYTHIYYVILLLFSAAVFMIGPYIIPILVGEKYFGVSNILGWLCLGQAFGGMYLMVTNYLFYAKDTKKLALITMIAGFINIALLTLCVSHFGLIGAAIAFTFSKLIQFMLTYIMAFKYT
ncbi:lipopolysaccharide biosynthesis protein [Photobacterium leiognathi]|uniref:lipopolysaccharide biosynthesis protein n=1 Tax=Photobacterium leiognathi TaxID=553611 RepID=UPI000D17272A|nr:oligosaccharide flippase family protein [Photobacterium leiognathi]PSW42965.1 polysaccharide biosynthesis protein [Photobacterium leiognathi subsp. mandapamensis]